MTKKIILGLTMLLSFASTSGAAMQVFQSADTGGTMRSKLNSNFSEHESEISDIQAGKETKAVVQASAPADTTVDWYDTDQEPGVLILKRHNGTTWLRASSHGVQYASSCASITAGMCVDTDDGKLYYHNGTAVVEVGTGGSGTTYTAGTGIEITSGVISSTVTGTLPSGTEGQGLQKGASAWESVNYAPLAFTDNVSRNTTTGVVSVPVTDTATSGSAVPLTSGGAYTALAGKENADSTIIKVAEVDTQAEFEALVGWPLPSGGTGGYVSLSAAPYSDVACTTGQYGRYESTGYLCTDGFWTSKWTLTPHSNPTPVTYSLTITPSGFNGADKFTYNSTDYTTEQVFTGLSADASFTVTPDTGREISCTGTGLTDNTGGSYTANTDTASAAASCTSTSAENVASIGTPTYSYVSSAGTGVISGNVPSGISDGDLLIATLADARGETTNAPSGWVKIGTSSNGSSSSSLFYRIASSEPSSYTWASIATTARAETLAIQAFRKHAGTWNVDTYSTSGAVSSGTSVTTGAVDVTSGSMLFVSASAKYNTAVSSGPSDMDSPIVANYANYPSHYNYTKYYQFSASTVSKTITYAASNPLTSFILVIKAL